VERVGRERKCKGKSGGPKRKQIETARVGEYRGKKKTVKGIREVEKGQGKKS
jgi:hypothetical protein